jgi:hypothetical protein
VNHRTLVVCSVTALVGVVGFSAPSGSAQNSNSAIIKRIVSAYPSTASQKGDALLINGIEVIVEDGKSGGTFDERMARADVVDQLSQPYPSGCPLREPGEGNDPGRLRSKAFFAAMYGSSQSTVRKQLVTVPWFGSSMQVTKVNGVDKALRAVADDLAAMVKATPELKQYLTPAGGSFNYRTIAGTNLPSTHSFGIAIDINTKYSDYWRWKSTTSVAPYNNRIPCEIGAAFERHGFIWGAKWWHFDTMHFEFRPELL